MLKLLVLSLAIISNIPAQEVNSNEWGKEFEKVMVGGKDDVQYSIYKKEGDAGNIYLELINRKSKDVKVTFKIVGKGIERGDPINMTGFIKANGFWPNGYDKIIKCYIPDPVIEITNVITGIVEEEQVIETDSDGKQIERYTYKFKSDTDLLKDKK